jgi:hypothetical protein
MTKNPDSLNFPARIAAAMRLSPGCDLKKTMRLSVRPTCRLSVARIYLTLKQTTGDVPVKYII